MSKIVPKTKCLYCQIDEAAAAEQIVTTNSGRSLWKKRQFFLYKKVLELAQIRPSQYCSEEHKDKIMHMRQVGRFTQASRLKSQVKKVMNSIYTLKQEEEIYKLMLQYVDKDHPKAHLQRARLHHHKNLLAQRRRRLKEMLPQVPENVELMEAFLTKEYFSRPDRTRKALRA